MKTTDFSKYISGFISRYLPDERGASANTINAYSYTFILLLNFVQKVKRIKIENLTLDKIKRETIVEFLDWLQKERNCRDSTRNLRLAAIHSFYYYLQNERIDNLHECQKILSIQFKKKQKREYQLFDS